MKLVVSSRNLSYRAADEWRNLNTRKTCLCRTKLHGICRGGRTGVVTSWLTYIYAWARELRLSSLRSRFFWQGSSQKHRYRLAKWDILCRPKDEGGLDILDLQLHNKCLLAKWLVNLLNTNGIWQSLLRNKYLRSKSLSQVTAKPNDSHFWRGLMHIKDEVLSKGTFEVKDGTNTRFWEDTW
jgi:hypothetical protein